MKKGRNCDAYNAKRRIPFQMRGSVDDIASMEDILIVIISCINPKR